MSMAPYSGLPFWTLLVLFAGACVLLHRLTRGTAARNLLFIGGSLAVIGLSQGGGRRALLLVVLLLLLSLLVYLIGRALGRDRLSRRTALATVSVVGIVLFLCYFKYSAVQHATALLVAQATGALTELGADAYQPIVFLGVSYFSFKMIHFLVECWRRKIETPDPLTFTSYVLFFPSYFGGPINRYELFARNLRERTPPDLLAAGKRIITGLFKKIVLAESLYPVSLPALDLSDPALTGTQAVLSVYAYTLFVYFDFSGYTDLAIGAGKLAGIDLPENFNYPFFRRNLRQFWANWHMSLTAWLTEYIYWPLARKLRHPARLKRRPTTTANIAIVMTFIVCGGWHGDGLNFFVWGAYHGVGLAILNGYTYLVRRYFPARWKRFVKQSKLAYAVSNLITVQFVVFGFLIFACDLERLRAFFAVFG